MTQEKLQNRLRKQDVSGRTAPQLAGSAITSSGEIESVTSETLAFDALRTDTYGQMSEEIAHRLATNPMPTTEERLMGTYVEALEPQVRSAVLTMHRKGYNASGSGFHGTDDNWRVLGIDNPLRTYDPANRRGQVMDFREPFRLADETRQQLIALGAEIPEYPGLEGQVARIGFTPTSPDVGEIETRWNNIVGVLPDTGIPAGPMMGSLEATGFSVYCPPDIHWPLDQFNASIPALDVIP